jgi:hypothetical protein
LATLAIYCNLRQSAADNAPLRNINALLLSLETG